MRPLSTDYRLAALSVFEVADAFEDATKLIARDHKFNGRKLKAGPLLNALVLHFLDMDEAERHYVAEKSLARLEQILAESDEEKQAAADRLKAILEEGRPVSAGKSNETEGHVRREKERKRAPRKPKEKNNSGQGHGHRKGPEASGVPRTVG